MRLLALGDIHGCYRALTTLEEFVGFSDDDLIITLGDYVDRGPQSKEVIEWVIDRTDRGQVIPLIGNHEIMMLGAMQGQFPMQHWLQFGGDQVIESYTPPGEEPHPEQIPISHLQFLDRRLLPYYETETEIFVHATVDARRPLDLQSEHSLFWERFETMEPHGSGKRVICGHSAQETGIPMDLGFAVCIDTWVYGDGWLTCFDVETGHYWQANQQGMTREYRIASMLRQGETLEPPDPPKLWRPSRRRERNRDEQQSEQARESQNPESGPSQETEATEEVHVRQPSQEPPRQQPPPPRKRDDLDDIDWLESN